MWKKLLVPVDFSPCSTRALRVAADLARAHLAELVLLHVSELPANLPGDTIVEPPGEPPLRVADYTVRGALRELELLADALRIQGLAVATRAVTGDVVDQILSATLATDAEALVVGTHGRTGFSRLRLGSVADKLMRRAPVPVVTVRATCPASRPTLEERDAEDELAG